MKESKENTLNRKRYQGKTLKEKIEGLYDYQNSIEEGNCLHAEDYT